MCHSMQQDKTCRKRGTAYNSHLTSSTQQLSCRITAFCLRLRLPFCSPASHALRLALSLRCMLLACLRRLLAWCLRLFASNHCRLLLLLLLLLRPPLKTDSTLNMMRVRKLQQSMFMAAMRSRQVSFDVLCTSKPRKRTRDVQPQLVPQQHCKQSVATCPRGLCQLPHLVKHCKALDLEQVFHLDQIGMQRVCIRCKGARPWASPHDSAPGHKGSHLTAAEQVHSSPCASCRPRCHSSMPHHMSTHRDCS